MLVHGLKAWQFPVTWNSTNPCHPTILHRHTVIKPLSHCLVDGHLAEPLQRLDFTGQSLLNLVDFATMSIKVISNALLLKKRRNRAG